MKRVRHIAILIAAVASLASLACSGYVVGWVRAQTAHSADCVTLYRGFQSPDGGAVFVPVEVCKSDAAKAPVSQPRQPAAPRNSWQSNA